MYSSQTPIDIHCAKLVDWLVQRRHCRKDWGENLASIRRKIKAALLDMPESEEIKQLLVGSKLDYFRSKIIVEILKTTEANSKNIFGYYSSQRMKDWQDVVYSYERDYIYLAEIATDLIRETNYEIPGVRRAIQKLKAKKDELEKERANFQRRAQQFQSEHQRLAQSYGIQGKDVIGELREQSKNLTSVTQSIVDLARKLKSGLEFYREYASSTSRQDANLFLPMLEHIISKNNTTVYEWRTGEVPESVLAEESPKSTSEASNPSEIEVISDEIDFGDDLPSSSESSSGFVHVEKSEDTFVNLEPENGKVARGNDAKLVLEYAKTRNQFLNNLYELEAFYKQLSSEEQTDSVRLDKSDIDKTISIIDQILELVNKEKIQVLFKISDSSTFIESVNEKFAQKLKQASECNIKAELASDRMNDIEQQIRDSELHLKRGMSLAKELQNKVESSISELYKGRTINIMGCFN